MEHRPDPHVTLAPRGGDVPPRGGRCRRFLTAALAFSLIASPACHSYRRMETAALVPGQRVQVDLNDQARVRLGDQLGAGVGSLHGGVVGRDGEQFIIAVSRVQHIGGGFSNWAGERVRLAPGDIARVQERRLSPGKTALVAGGIIGGLVLLTLGMDWIGFGADDDGRGPRDPTGPES